MIGAVAPSHYSIMGFLLQPDELIATTAPAIARSMVAEGVDAALQGLAGRVVELQSLRHQATTAKTSRALRMRYSSPWCLTSVPPYLL